MNFKINLKKKDISNISRRLIDLEELTHWMFINNIMDIDESSSIISNMKIVNSEKVEYDIDKIIYFLHNINSDYKNITYPTNIESIIPNNFPHYNPYIKDPIRTNIILPLPLPTNLFSDEESRNINKAIDRHFEPVIVKGFRYISSKIKSFLPKKKNILHITIKKKDNETSR